jgi:membrane protease YdiL (CAAX protease family)
MRKLALLEPLLMSGLIMAYIWKLRFVCPTCWTVIPGLMIFSHLLRHESPHALGFRLHNLAATLNELGPMLLVIALLLLSAGMVLRTLRQTALEEVVFAVAAYLPWGLSQQYALNGHFLNRFDAALSNRAASFLAALCFCAAHAPNPFLMTITLPLGWGSTLLYRRTRNLYFLGFAHATVGLLLFLVVPDSISRHLRVGPGWFRP